jgi:sugar-phosphatase
VFEAAIFDMDGVLIDSEPIWREVEVEVFGALGVPLTERMCLQTMGLRVNEMVDFWYERYPWSGADRADVAVDVMNGVMATIRRKGAALEGVDHAVTFLRGRGLRLAIASSSYHVVIETVLDVLGLGHAFDVVHSAEDEPHGKPHPGVYLTTADKLGVAPGACVALEDSPNGVRSAKGAGMACIAIPEPGVDVSEADLVLPSLVALDDAIWPNLRQ